MPSQAIRTTKTKALEIKPDQALALPRPRDGFLSPLAGRGECAAGGGWIKGPTSVRDEPGLGHQFLVLLLVRGEELHELLACPEIGHEGVALHVFLPLGGLGDLLEQVDVELLLLERLFA